MSWLYIQKSGRLLHGGVYFATGYAGRGVGKNNPAMQDAKGIGPLPCGWYTMQEPEDRPESVGPYAIPLLPDPANEMFDRASFFMHGDSIEHPGLASHGCIVEPRFIRQQVWLSGDRRLQVIATEEDLPHGE